MSFWNEDIGVNERQMVIMVPFCLLDNMIREKCGLRYYLAREFDIIKLVLGTDDLCDVDLPFYRNLKSDSAIFLCKMGDYYIEPMSGRIIQSVFDKEKLLKYGKKVNFNIPLDYYLSLLNPDDLIDYFNGICDISHFFDNEEEIFMDFQDEYEKIIINFWRKFTDYFVDNWSYFFDAHYSLSNNDLLLMADWLFDDKLFASDTEINLKLQMAIEDIESDLSFLKDMLEKIELDVQLDDFEFNKLYDLVIKINDNDFYFDTYFMLESIDNLEKKRKELLSYDKVIGEDRKEYLQLGKYNVLKQLWVNGNDLNFIDADCKYKDFLREEAYKEKVLYQ